MLQIKKLKSLNTVQISFVISIIVYQEVGCKYFNISCRLEIIKKKILIDHHYNTLDRIYWYPHKWQNLLNFLQGVTSIFTNHIHSMMVRYCFHRCLSVHTCGVGGYPSQIRMGGTPVRWAPPSQVRMGGYPSQEGTHLVYPLARL